jgi:cell division protein ZapA
MGKGTIKVNIFGQEYPIVGDDEEVYIKKLAQFVDSEMRKNSDQAPMLPTSKIAVLTCLNILDRFMKYKKENHHKIQDMLTQCDALLEKVSQQINKNG